MTATVSFIGTGKMGAALIKGLSGIESIKLLGYDLDREKLNALCAECTLDAVEYIDKVKKRGTIGKKRKTAKC